MQYKYIPRGVCSREIHIELDGNIIKKVSFVGGCNGNLQGVSRLVEGMTYEEVKKRLSGIHCGFKPTSCPDQLTHALDMAMEQSRLATKE